MKIYEVEAMLPGKAFVKAENEDEAIEMAACLTFDEFNWNEFYLEDIKELNNVGIKAEEIFRV